MRLVFCVLLIALASALTAGAQQVEFKSRTYQCVFTKIAYTSIGDHGNPPERWEWNKKGWSDDTISFVFMVDANGDASFLGDAPSRLFVFTGMNRVTFMEITGSGSVQITAILLGSRMIDDTYHAVHTRTTSGILPGGSGSVMTGRCKISRQ